MESAADFRASIYLRRRLRTKLAKVMLDESLPLGHYTGVDVAPEVIEWLRAYLSDPSFKFCFLNRAIHLTTPVGSDWLASTCCRRGRGSTRWSLFSVFTHLAPADFVWMLRLGERRVQARREPALLSLHRRP